VTKGADVVMTSLPMPKDVEAVTLGDTGILASIAKGQTYIDLSTNAPSMVKKIGAAFAAKGIAMLDAPVSGGTTGPRPRPSPSWWAATRRCSTTRCPCCSRSAPM
jgi:3-hydroxyisobutyrate dehydrogenase-like beta-hydroxyacid dehydrogenase